MKTKTVIQDLMNALDRLLGDQRCDHEFSPQDCEYCQARQALENALKLKSKQVKACRDPRF